MQIHALDRLRRRVIGLAGLAVTAALVVLTGCSDTPRHTGAVAQIAEPVRAGLTEALRTDTTDTPEAPGANVSPTNGVMRSTIVVDATPAPASTASTAAATAADDGEPVMQSDAPVPPTPTPAAGGLCSEAGATAFAHQLLDPHGIPVPAITMIPQGQRSYYLMSSSTVFVATCGSLDATAHEIGHYVMDRANSLNFTLHVADAAAHFTGANWISGAEAYPGVEYAAHCIGNQLFGSGTYTKCPDATMAAYAAAVIARA